MADVQLSEFQKKKLLHLFSTFYDINQDGMIEWEDFEMAIEKTRKLHGWEHNGTQYKKAKDSMTLVWDGLREVADKNKDNLVTKEEWFKMWQQSISKMQCSGNLPDWLKKYRDFMFDVNDKSNDDIIDMNEYRTVYTNYGISKEAAESAFNMFSENDTVKITRDVFNKLWKEYFTSNDPADKGNSLFGKTSF